MPTRAVAALGLVGSAACLFTVLCGCTPGGQFDPTEVISTDIFNTKKKIQGDREPLFPNGVPGAENGVPRDLVKGYQTPPEQAADNTEPAVKPEGAAPKPQPKPKPKPKVAHAPAPQRGQPAQAPWPNPAQPNSVQANWPPPQTGQAQTNWPAPPSTAQSPQGAAAAQTNWPPPPPIGQAQGVAVGQSSGPNPPAAPTSSH